ncbi:MAG TPA: phospholipase D-like domain-containing protein [Gaiellaceae bacterium]|nr:phospholipase D-like domain-containing protein [Gaiellaceae bacterium]
MRAQAAAGGLSVQAIAGTHVVLFGFNLPKNKTKNLLGFALRRTDKSRPNAQPFYLDNFLLLKANDKGEKPDHSSANNPFQAFLWGDYTLAPGKEYEYLVEARYGTPGALRTGASVMLSVTTESETGDTQDVFFDRGVAGSQAYARRFTPPGKRNPLPPDQAGPDAWRFLSRGLAEAMQAFIAQANGPALALRAAVYEFTDPATLQAFADAAAMGADVKIVYDAVRNGTPKRPKDTPREDNDKAIDAAGIRALCQERIHTKIAHNKFIVLLENGVPESVWTGSTNLTEGGLYGQWNVGHIVRDRAVAKRYFEFWQELAKDQQPSATRQWNEAETPLPPAPSGMDLVFSPRGDLGALNWYASLMDNATTSVFLTAAFGVSKELTAIFAQPKPYLRYLLLDKRQGDVKTIARSPSNRITAGGYFGGKEGTPFANWMREALTGLNTYVQYVHTKIMLIDPLGDDPIVITGSANFSESSTTNNDENMLVIRGDARLADIYLGEFMRLFTHFRFRGHTKTPNTHPAPGPGTPRSALAPQTKAKGTLYLADTDRWVRGYYVKGSPREKERLLFAAP